MDALSGAELSRIEGDNLECIGSSRIRDSRPVRAPMWRGAWGVAFTQEGAGSSREPWFRPHV